MDIFSATSLRRYGKPIAHAALALPLLMVIGDVYDYITTGFSVGLGANPPEALNRHLGQWALRVLILSLVITPLSTLIGSPKPVLFRRMVGLWAFAYVVLHLASYIALDKVFEWDEIWQDIVKRTFITLGMAAFVLLILLAATSTNWAVRKLKAKRWKRLHRLVYPAVILAAVHFIMMRKGLQIEPLIYAGIVAALLGFRLVGRARRGL